MADISTASVKSNSLKINILPEDIHNEFIENGLINENELYLVEEESSVLSLREGGTGVAVNSVIELRSVIGAAATDHTSEDKSCGTGNSIKFGHVKLSDSVDLDSGENDGIAATPAAIKNLYQLIKELIDNKADINSNGTISSLLNNYAEVAKWSDDNILNEDRVGYFVSIDTDGIKKSSEDSITIGVTVAKPGFTTNANEEMYDDNGELLSKYNYMVSNGFVTVIDNGECVVNERCMSNNDGIAIPSINDMGYYVVSRVDNTHVVILMDSQVDSLIKLQSNVNDKQNKLAWVTTDDIDAMLAGTYVPGSTPGYVDDDDDLIIFSVKE